jgi:hypothetical protein
MLDVGRSEEQALVRERVVFFQKEAAKDAEVGEGGLRVGERSKGGREGGRKGAAGARWSGEGPGGGRGRASSIGKRRSSSSRSSCRRVGGRGCGGGEERLDKPAFMRRMPFNHPLRKMTIRTTHLQPTLLALHPLPTLHRRHATKALRVHLCRPQYYLFLLPSLLLLLLLLLLPSLPPFRCRPLPQPRVSHPCFGQHGPEDHRPFLQDHLPWLDGCGGDEVAALVAVEGVACAGCGGGGGGGGGLGRAGFLDWPAALKLVYGPMFSGEGRRWIEGGREGGGRRKRR